MNDKVYEYEIIKALVEEKKSIWLLIQQGIAKRKEEGSNQWQDGYPNEEVIANDIEKGYGYVVKDNEKLLGYFALIFDKDDAYENIKGKWLSNGEYAVIHRLVTNQVEKRKGLAQYILEKIEQFVKKESIHSIKADTNYDNVAMLKLFEKQGYIYCGEVIMRGSERKAFEKVLR